MIKNNVVSYISFLGPYGSYSHIAAMQYINTYTYKNKKIIGYSCQNFTDVITMVKNQKTTYGILPIENSNSGIIYEVYNLLNKNKLKLINEIVIPIQHRMLGNIHANFHKIQIIYSHMQPIKQCSKFLKYFPHWKIILCTSSAAAIQTVSISKNPYIAALGSALGGIYYGLHPLLYHDISNSYINTTRFIVIRL